MTIITDQIKGRVIFSVEKGEISYMVGVVGVTKIEAYEEPGQVNHVPWFVVYVGDGQVWARLDAAGCVVSYKVMIKKDR